MSARLRAHKKSRVLVQCAEKNRTQMPLLSALSKDGTLFKV